MKDRQNIQIADLVKAMAQSEPCLFSNSTNNLMPVTEKTYKMEEQNYLELIRDILRITKNVEGAGLAREVETVLSKYQDFINTTPVPERVAKWVSDLYDLLDNCEGAGLQRELANLKSPLKVSAS